MMLDDLEDLTPVGVDNLGVKQVILKAKGGGKTPAKQGVSNVIIKPDSPSKFDNIDEDDYDQEDDYEEDDDEYDEEQDNTRTSAKELK
jgi:hypothetical protein